MLAVQKKVSQAEGWTQDATHRLAENVPAAHGPAMPDVHHHYEQVDALHHGQYLLEHG